MLRSGTVSVERPSPSQTHQHASRLADDDGLTALASALEHPDAERRARAVAIVTELADKRVGRLLKVMIHDRSAAVRAVAASAAGRTMDMDLVPALIVALGDPDIDVRRTAAEAVSRVTRQAVVPSATNGTVSAEEVLRLKRWWKDQRVQDLTRYGERER
jgi:HEAT repeat protein